VSTRHETAVWRSPAALWSTDAPNLPPALLRYASDDFMDRLAGTLSTDPARLADALVASETWENERVGLADALVDGQDPVPLYQPTHGRFYLVTATLSCLRYGLPDRRVDTGRDESVGYVLRRTDAVDGRVRESGLDADGRWALAPDGRLVIGEPIHPLSAMPHAAPHGSRRLLVGLLPAAARERLAGAAEEPAAPAGDSQAALGDNRLARALSGVVTPLRFALRDDGRDAIDAPTFLAGVRASVFFALLEMAELLVAEQRSGATALDARLRSWFVPPGVPGRPSLRWSQALAQTRAQAASDPDLLFSAGDPPPVAGRSLDELRAAIRRLGIEDTDDPLAVPFLTELAETLRPLSSPPGDDHPAEEAPPEQRDDATYVVRCVYLRPRCPAPLDVTLSEPSRPFTIASFFDPDAPARDIQIALPGDTSLGSLRRYPKNVSLVLSKQLRAQVKRAARVAGAKTDAPGGSMDWVMHLSIPIVTICALLVLMIVVHLLHVVFWWLPAFIVWRPRMRLR
jgi:hypothetical protein